VALRMDELFDRVDRERLGVLLVEAVWCSRPRAYNVSKSALDFQDAALDSNDA